jgi:predicted nucleotidyltransferase
MDINEKILKELKNYLLQNIGDEISDVILFGSRMNRTYAIDSDYDVLIIVKKNYDNKFEEQIIDLCYDIDLKYDVIIDPHILSTTELQSLRGKQPIFINAINNGIYA